MKAKGKARRFARLTLTACLFAGAVAIGAERSASPLSSQQELATFHFTDEDLTAELVASEPDGDGRADERRVLLTGFVEGNQQLRVNGLYWGLDNWIYGANGRSDGEVQWVAQAIQPAGSGDVPSARSRAESKSSGGRLKSPPA